MLMSKENPIKGVIFDMDGLLLDTERLTYDLCSKAAEQMGFTLSMELFKTTVGLRSPDTRKIYEKEFGEGFDYDRLREQNIAWFWEYIKENGAPVKKGVFELLSFLRDNEIKSAVATSTSSATAPRILEKAGITVYVDAVVCGDMVERGKPEPDIFLEAAKRLKLPPEQCVGLEDSINGILSVYKAGMLPVMVPDLLPPTEEVTSLLYAQADDLEQVIPIIKKHNVCLLYTSPSPRDTERSRMPSSA